MVLYGHRIARVLGDSGMLRDPSGFGSRFSAVCLLTTLCSTTFGVGHGFDDAQTAARSMADVATGWARGGFSP